jgi:DNA-nicking Smr family endonuclease
LKKQETIRSFGRNIGRKIPEDDHSSWLEEIKGCRRIIANRGKLLPTPSSIIVMENGRSKNVINQNCRQPQGPIFKLEKNKSLGLDRNTDRKLKGGKMKIDMKIDFHGLTADMALNMLLHSVEAAHGSGLRCILAITGKGKNTDPERISIKSQLEKWMQLPTISSRVIKYVDAALKHGGKGAVYIQLKNSR